MAYAAYIIYDTAEQISHLGKQAGIHRYSACVSQAYMQMHTISKVFRYLQ